MGPLSTIFSSMMSTGGRKRWSRRLLTCLLPHSRFLLHHMITRDLWAFHLSAFTSRAHHHHGRPTSHHTTKALTVFFFYIIYLLRFFDDQVECNHIRDQEKSLFFFQGVCIHTQTECSISRSLEGRCNRYGWLPLRINQLLNAVGWAKEAGNERERESTWMPRAFV